MDKGLIGPKAKAGLDTVNREKSLVLLGIEQGAKTDPVSETLHFLVFRVPDVLGYDM
jgi:hypothetical protein